MNIEQINANLEDFVKSTALIAIPETATELINYVDQFVSNHDLVFVGRFQTDSSEIVHLYRASNYQDPYYQMDMYHSMQQRMNEMRYEHPEVKSGEENV